MIDAVTVTCTGFSKRYWIRAFHILPRAQPWGLEGTAGAAVGGEGRTRIKVTADGATTVLTTTRTVGCAVAAVALATEPCRLSATTGRGWE